jgi:23S rRNA pseudouridine2605 synthase
MEREETVKLWRVVQEQAGLSRRKAQEMVAAGEVKVNGRLVEDPFFAIEKKTLEGLCLRGHPLSLLEPEHRAYRYYKPIGVLCSHDDPHCGNTVGRILRSEGFIGYSWAGRLDQDSEGLVLLTNYGDLVEHLTHPRYQVKKVYQVYVRRFPPARDMKRIFHEMRSGVEEGGETLRISKGEMSNSRAYAVLALAEGKKHEVKRLFAHFDLKVVRLRRVAIGPVKLAGLAPGEIARLDPKGIENLDRLIESHSHDRKGGTAIRSDL